jgi:oleandomycin transport system permease protein
MTELSQALAPRTPFARISTARATRNGLTLAWRNVTQLKHTPEKLLDTTLIPIVFLLLFLWVFGGAVAGDTHTYLQQLLPGMFAQMAMFATMGVGTTINEDIQRGVFDRFRSLPISRSAPLVGAVLGDTVRFVITMVVLTGVGLALGFRFHTNPLSLLAAYGLCYVIYLAFCWFALLVGLVAGSPAATQGFTVIWTLPLTFGSNIFTAKTSGMPGWLQAWVKVNPISHLADAVRALTTGGSVGNHAWYTMIWSAGIILVASPLALRMYNRRVV